MHQRTTFLAIALLFALTTFGAAQTTGIPGFNDYTINGLISGSTSCTNLTFTTPVALNFSVTTAPTATAVGIIIGGFCSPNSFPLATCQGTTFDIALAPVAPSLATTLAPTSPGLFGFSFTVPLLPFPVRFATQAVIIDPACSPFPLFTQAYDVTLL